MQKQIRGNEYRTTLICVDSYKDGVPTGHYSNPFCEARSFHGLTQLLTGMEDMLNQMKFPQSFTTARKFYDVEPFLVETPREQAQNGVIGTFAVRVLFRQNASWQGSVKWLEGDKEEQFRSVLELVLLMDSALRAKN